MISNYCFILRYNQPLIVRVFLIIVIEAAVQHCYGIAMPASIVSQSFTFHSFVFKNNASNCLFYIFKTFSVIRKFQCVASYSSSTA